MMSFAVTNCAPYFSVSVVRACKLWGEVWNSGIKEGLIEFLVSAGECGGAGKASGRVAEALRRGPLEADVGAQQQQRRGRLRRQHPPGQPEPLAGGPQPPGFTQQERRPGQGARPGQGPRSGPRPGQGPGQGQGPRSGQGQASLQLRREEPRQRQEQEQNQESLEESQSEAEQASQTH